MWKINFNCTLFLSLCNTKEIDSGTNKEVDSKGVHNDASNNDIPPHKKLKIAKKTLRSIIMKSPARKKQKELMKKRKSNFNKTKQKNITSKQVINKTSKNQSIITKTLAFKKNIKFMKLLNDSGMDVSDERRK